MMRLLRATVAVIACVPLAGCFQSTTAIRIKGDGSGTIEQRTLLTDAAVDQLRAFAILGGGRAADLDNPISEDQARSFASAIGSGVTYVSSTPVKTSAAQGREARYAFTDITQIRISEQPQMGIGGSTQAAGAGGIGASSLGTQPISFGMTTQSDGNVMLRILVPRPNILPASPADANTALPINLQQIELVKQMLAGAHLTIAVEPEGRLVRTSSPYVDGNRVVLLDVDVDQAAGDAALLEKLQSVKTIDDAKAAIAGAAGLKINLDPEITIEFTPAK